MAMTRQERINVHKKQGIIDSVKEAFKNDTSIVVNSLSVLQDSTGGTVSDVLVDAAGGTYPTDEEYVNAVASLAAKINDILSALKSAGIVK
jgi:transcription initiation factor IIE alpha subunit